MQTEELNIGYQILVWVLGILGTVITTVVIPYFATWLNNKTKNEKLNYVINEITSLATTSINYVQQTFVDQLKKDGKFDKENQAIAFDKAMQYCRDNLSTTATRILEKESVEIEEFIKGYIESAIFDKNKLLQGQN